MKRLGLGTLSLSGLYEKKSIIDVKKEINLIDPKSFSFVDWAYVYSSNGVNVLKILSSDALWNNKQLILKVGRLKPSSFNDISFQVSESLKNGWIGPVLIMFHTVGLEYVNDQLEIIDKLRKEFSYLRLDFGLSLHSFNQLSALVNVFVEIKLRYVGFKLLLFFRHYSE